MHLLEEPDQGHSMINYDGKVRKERKEEEKSSAPGGNRTLDLTITRRAFYHCATFPVQEFMFKSKSEATGFANQSKLIFS